MELDYRADGRVDPLAALAAGTERSCEQRAHRSEVPAQASFDERAKRGNRLGVAEDIARHRFRFAVPRVEIPKRESQSDIRAVDRSPGGWIGRGVKCSPVRRTGREERSLVGEVVVDRDSLNARTSCDFRNPGRGRTERPVQLDSRLDNPPPSLIALFGPLFLYVFAPLHRLNLLRVRRNLTIGSLLAHIHHT